MIKILLVLLVIANLVVVVTNRKRVPKQIDEKGVFDANINVSIRQMAAYAALILSVAACVGSFIEQNGSDSGTNSQNAGRP